MRFRSGVRAVSRRKRLTGAHAARPSVHQGLKVAAAVVAPLLVAVGLIALVAANDGGDGGGSAAPSSTTTVTASHGGQGLPGEGRRRLQGRSATPSRSSCPRPGVRGRQGDPGRLQGRRRSGPAGVREGPRRRGQGREVQAGSGDQPATSSTPPTCTWRSPGSTAWPSTRRPSRSGPSSTSPPGGCVRWATGSTTGAGCVLDPSFYGASSQDVELRPPTEVPDWVAEGMAAGPPLAETPGPPASSPPVREATCGNGCRPSRAGRRSRRRSGRAG